MSLLSDRENDILEMDLQELSGLLRNWIIIKDKKEIIKYAHSLSNQINKELLISLEIDFGIEVFTLSKSLLSSKNPNLNLNGFFTFENYMNNENDDNNMNNHNNDNYNDYDSSSNNNNSSSWLSRYGAPKSNCSKNEINNNKLKKIKNDLICRKFQNDTDKEIILLKIQKSCETLRVCSSKRKIIEDEHVRTQIFIPIFDN